MILDFRSDACYRRFKQPGIMAICLKVGGQEDGVRNKLRRLHKPHTGGDPENSRLIGGGCNYAPADVIPEVQELPATVFENRRLLICAAANYDRQSAQFRVAQQLHGCVKSIHIKMSNPPALW
jgi:hypothetical protein